jgi:hypothetical protein
MLRRFWYPPSAHPQTHGLVERANRLILQGMKTRMFHDLEARCRNYHKQLPLVLWALRTNINRATRDIPFNLVYEADVVLPPEIYLESTKVTYFNVEDQAEAKELDSNMLEFHKYVPGLGPSSCNDPRDRMRL